MPGWLLPVASPLTIYTVSRFICQKTVILASHSSGHELGEAPYGLVCQVHSSPYVKFITWIKPLTQVSLVSLLIARLHT